VVHKLHMISQCLYLSSKIIRSESKGVTKHVVRRSETASERTKRVSMDSRRDLVPNMTKHTAVPQKRCNDNKNIKYGEEDPGIPVIRRICRVSRRIANS